MATVTLNKVILRMIEIEEYGGTQIFKDTMQKICFFLIMLACRIENNVFVKKRNSN